MSETASIYSLAKEELSNFGGNAELAIEALSNRIDGDVDLLRAIVRGAVISCIKSNVGSVISNERSSIIGATISPVPFDAKARIERLGNAIKVSLLDTPLTGGKLLRQCTRDEIQNVAMLYEKQSNTMGIRARWLKLVADAVPEDQTVGEALTDADVLNFYREAEGLAEPPIIREPARKRSAK